MREIIVNSIPELTDAQINIVSLHSVLNVLHVIKGELQLLGLEYGDENLLKQSLTTCNNLVADLQSGLEVWKTFAVPSYKANVSAELAKYNWTTQKELINHFFSVIDILQKRFKDIQGQQLAKWITCSGETLQTQLKTFLQLSKEHSKSRFSFNYGSGQLAANEYRVLLDFPPTFPLPNVFNDVIRDLLANARKYSPIGSTISVSIKEQQHTLVLCIEDNGRGIPDNELDKVTHYGVRGSNCQDIRTLGGGFGLTKAFLATKEFRGTFKIASQIGQGTRITIEIPTVV